jgi:hypothetical protein
MTSTSSLRGKSAIVGVGTAGLGEAPGFNASKMSTAFFAPI